MIYESLSAEGKELIDPEYPFTKIADGFRFLEGPVWHPYEKHLTFSDIMGNALYRWIPQDGVTLLKQNSYLTNGNTYDRSGCLISCEHGTSSLSKMNKDGSRTVLADSYNGKGLNSPNDAVVRSDGLIYFTDPVSGRNEKFGIPRKPELAFSGVYVYNPKDRSLQLLVNDFEKPNGLCFSPDEKYLYVNDTIRQHIRKFSVDKSGKISGGEVLCDLILDGPGVADGLKVSKDGLLFCSAPRGIQIFSPNGNIVGRLYVPEFPANFTWGGPELDMLFLCSTTTLYSVRTSIKGIPVL